MAASQKYYRGEIFKNFWGFGRSGFGGGVGKMTEIFGNLNFLNFKNISHE